MHRSRQVPSDAARVRRPMRNCRQRCCPTRGRKAADARPGAPATALVSERFVRAHLAGDFAAAPGHTIRLDGVPTTIVGVVPTACELPVGTDVWRPLVLDAAAIEDRASRTLTAVGRLRPGATLGAASNTSGRH